VFVTRSATDTVPTVAERLETATGADATVLVGIDLASGGEAGLRVLTASAAGQSGETFARSAAFASSVTRAARLPGLVVLEPAVSEDPVVLGFTGPAIRVVVGDGTAEADRARMADPGWADSVARAIYRGLGMELAPQ
jgi:N-acetylmuramoyl-L-alanine amidase